jgi:hypothetical protein
VSKYLTKRDFAGRRARVGDIVVLAARKPGDVRGCFTCDCGTPCWIHDTSCLRAGIVGAISSSQDLPYLRDLKAGEVDKNPNEWEFVRTSSVDEIEALEIGQWTWPLKEEA